MPFILISRSTYNLKNDHQQIHGSFHICIKTDQLAIEGYQLDGVEHESYPDEDMGHFYDLLDV